jgi:prophage antirepressor-like protein
VIVGQRSKERGVSKMKLESYIDLSEIESFEFDGEVWYKAVDFGEVIGFTKPSRAINKLLNNNRASLEGLTILRKVPKASESPATGKPYIAYRETLLLNREAIIRLLFITDMPKARQFRESLIKTL